MFFRSSVVFSQWEPFVDVIHAACVTDTDTSHMSDVFWMNSPLGGACRDDPDPPPFHVVYSNRIVVGVSAFARPTRGDINGGGAQREEPLHQQEPVLRPSRSKARQAFDLRSA